MRPSLIKHNSIAHSFVPAFIKLTQQQPDKTASKFIGSSEILSSISHELRSPLNAIVGFGELLKCQKTTKEESEEYINEILQAADEMRDLINDLLDAGTVAGNFSANIGEKINAADVIARAVKLNLDYALKRKITIKNETLNLELINLDAKRLKQILVNLISNAVKYSPKDTEIKIFATQVGAALQITISDQGFGMSQDQLKIAFDKYRTFNNPNSETVDSFGLGLPIVKQLTELMNGTIEMTSEINKGTEVKLTFPYLM